MIAYSAAAQSLSDPRQVGCRVAELQKMLGINRHEFAEKTGIDITELSKFELGLSNAIMEPLTKIHLIWG